MNWFYAKDGQQAGPIDDTQLAALVASGTITGSTLVWREGMTQWQPYQQVWVTGMPDWRSATSSAPGVSTDPTAASSPGSVNVCSVCRNTFPPEDLITLEGNKVCAVCKPTLLQRLREGVPGSATLSGLQPLDPDTLVNLSTNRQYSLDVTACLSAAWELFKRQPALLIGAFVVINLCIMAGAMIPFLGSCVGLFINGPLMAGLWSVYLRALRGESVSVGDSFAGFSKQFWPLVGTSVLVGILAYLAFLPAAIAFGVQFMLNSGRPPEGPQLVLTIALGLLALPVAIYLTVAWIFALPLVIDRGYGVWDAMNASRRIVTRRFFSVILMGLLSIVLCLAGAFALCVGLFVAVPVVMAMFSAAYEELCGSKVRAN